MGFLNNIKLFFEGALDFKNRATFRLELAYEEEMEEFMILAFSDIIGIDMPTTYYALEMYPHLYSEIERWQKMSVNRKSVWEDKFSKMEMDP
ncbi:MAG TPA: hypothetical protein PLO47_00940 [Bacillota bacterium]|nr:hypothetical protein [Bacillota bacterium]